MNPSISRNDRVFFEGLTIQETFFVQLTPIRHRGDNTMYVQYESLVTCTGTLRRLFRLSSYDVALGVCSGILGSGYPRGCDKRASMRNSTKDENKDNFYQK
jgi:hypothetical protein